MDQWDYEPPHVRRITTDDAGSSHIEPPHDPTWDDLTSLRWWAAVVEHDTGLRVRVAYHDRQWSISLVNGDRSVGLGAYTFSAAWRTLANISTGAQLARHVPAS